MFGTALQLYLGDDFKVCTVSLSGRVEIFLGTASGFALSCSL